MKNSFKRVLAVALSAAMVLTAAPLASINANAATKVKLSATKGTIKVGKTKKVTIKGLKKSNIKSVKFTYSNTKKRVTVKRSGLTIKITGKKKGTVTVTATIKLKKAVNKKKTYKLKYKATVKKAAATKVATTKIELPAEVKVEVGKTATVTATRTPSNANDAITWTSKDEGIAKVDANGVVTGVKIGETEISAVAGTATPATAKVIVTEATASKDVKITGAKVVKADTIEVTFADTMDDSKLGIDLKLGSVSISKTITWDEAKKIATLKTAANLAKGTYTIEAAYAESEAKDSTTIEVEAQKATEIKILNETALTAQGYLSDGKSEPAAVAPAGKSLSESAKAYAYYDVLDQYGNSMRTSVSVDWSASCEKKVDKARGRITLWKGDGKAFTYGEKVYVTGVDTKTGLVVNQEVTIGQAQALNTVKILGFIKKGSTTILNTVPKNFKAGEYQLVFSILDQNGCEMDPTEMGGKLNEQVTFTSSDVLVISKAEVSKTEKDQSVTLDGVSYGVAALEPGINVSKGGTVKLTAIANKTGNQTEIEVNVEVEALLTSFVLGSPSGVLADGESVELPFTATDADGKKITNFRTIAQNKTFNTLTFSVSGKGVLQLSEANDGSAVLTYHDDTTGTNWTDSTSTDGIDRTVSLTSIVVGGDTSNELLQISDKAYPVSVASTTLNNAYVEGDDMTLTLDGLGTTFGFVDQYGRTMDGDNGFFAAAKSGALKGRDFTNYKFGLRASYLGAATADNSWNLSGTQIKAKQEFYLQDGDSKKFTVDTKIDDKAITGEGFKFEIVKTTDTWGAASANYDVVSKAYNHDITLVDISKVTGFTVGDISTIFIGSTAGTTTDGYLKTGVGAPAITNNVVMSGLFANKTEGNHIISVSGTYQGSKVNIPAQYVRLTSGKLSTLTANTANLDGTFLNARDKIQFQGPKADLKYSDLYDRSVNNNPAKIGKDTLRATVANAYANTIHVKAHEKGVGTDGYVTSATALGILIANADRAETVVDTVTKAYEFSDQPEYAATIVGVKDSYIVNPSITVLNTVALVTPEVSSKGWDVLNQYGMPCGGGVTFKVNEIKEAAGYVDGNFKVVKNDSPNASVEGAEIGDTFTLTISAGTTLSKSFKVTVGADGSACIKNGDNFFLKTLIGDEKSTSGLEFQRRQVLDIKTAA